MSDEKKILKLLYPDVLEKKYINYANFQITGNELNIDIGYVNSHNLDEPEAEIYERLILSKDYMKSFAKTLTGLIDTVMKDEK